MLRINEGRGFSLLFWAKNDEQLWEKSAWWEGNSIWFQTFSFTQNLKFLKLPATQRLEIIEHLFLYYVDLIVQRIASVASNDFGADMSVLTDNSVTDTASIWSPVSYPAVSIYSLDGIHEISKIQLVDDNMPSFSIEYVHAEEWTQFENVVTNGCEVSY